ncbi:MAG: SH3 domain-containing protein [Cyanobacteria bacterium P01_F01_bin.42]
MMNQPTPMPSLLANRYRVLRVLGDGGFGTTYLAEDSQMPSRRKCVVKQLKPVEDNPEIYRLVKDRFQREAAILETLGDGFEQIPNLYAYFSEGEQFYLVEEWVEGETLTQKVQREGALSEPLIRDILSQTLPVLSYVHQKRMVHRDIKPDNIIIRQTDQKPILIDFGAVKETMSTVVNSQGNSTRSIVVGTPGFMPSEQMAGRPLFSSDLYSLGLTAIYLLTGRVPQDLETDPVTGQLHWQQYASGVTPGFAALLNQAIQMTPSDRFQSADQMLTSLQSLEAATTAPIPAGVEPTEIHIPMPPQAAVPQSPPSQQATPYQSPQAPQSSPSPVPESVQATVQVPGFAAAPQSVPPTSEQAVPQSNGDWKKAGLIGGIIGLSILGGAMMLQAQIGDFIGSLRSPQSEEVVPTSTEPATPEDTTGSLPSSPAPTPTPTPAPSAPTPAPVLTPAPTDPPENWDTDAQIIGAAGQKNIRSGPGTGFGVRHIAYPGDRVQVMNANYDDSGYLWYQIYFPQSEAEGWIAAQLLQVDGQPVYKPPAPKPQPEPEPTPEPAPDSNAVIIGASGAKNIRSGPGTGFKVAHIAYPGDRIQVMDSDYDGGGYQWYRVYFPKSGADGWIAAQLVRLD